MIRVEPVRRIREDHDLYRLARRLRRGSRSRSRSRSRGLEVCHRNARVLSTVQPEQRRLELGCNVGGGAGLEGGCGIADRPVSGNGGVFRRLRYDDCCL